eukprot:m.165760 g.165760  ORF g.165760 m.165760 type:complete len:125 (+) comp38903_c0_seq1:2955-3329(+)
MQGQNYQVTYRQCEGIWNTVDCASWLSLRYGRRWACFSACPVGETEMTRESTVLIDDRRLSQQQSFTSLPGTRGSNICPSCLPAGGGRARPARHQIDRDWAHAGSSTAMRGAGGRRLPSEILAR